MRDNKFRGKRVDNGEWAYGSLVILAGSRYYIKDDSLKTLNPRSISTEGWADIRCFEVDTSTVGQYTGLKDKNGKEIYEGDAVIANLHYFNIKNEICKVIFKNGSFGIQYGYCDDYFKSFAAWDNFEVIGNIHDNPELLKE